MSNDAVRRLTILGSTGSIGGSTLDVVARHRERFAISTLTAHRRIDRLFEQCRTFRPPRAVVGNGDDAARLRKRLRAAGVATEVVHGPAALCEAAESPDCDCVVAAIVGAAGLPASLAAARAGKKILLANKEALVMSGALFMQAVADGGATLLPLDSEHNAISQCLAGAAAAADVDHLILTASGGPFLEHPADTLVDVTPAQACAHPNWSMGRKISVDSATMMNKGLEAIEAHWLFAMPAERIRIVIHPQSVIHSMVAYVDGSVLAQLGHPDMRTPIAQALAHPARFASGVAPLDFARLQGLTFATPDLRRFPCLKLALDVLHGGCTASIALNAANEVAVEAFLDRRIRFTEIADVVDDTLQRIAAAVPRRLEDILEVDARSRAAACRAIRRLAAPMRFSLAAP